MERAVAKLDAKRLGLVAVTFAGGAMTAASAWTVEVAPTARRGGETCDLAHGDVATLAARIAPRVFQTQGGRLVRLADIAGLESRHERSLIGSRVRIVWLSTAPDRHGIHPAYMVSAADTARFIQRELVESGRAYVAPETLPEFRPAPVEPIAASGPPSPRDHDARTDRLRTICLDVLFAAERKQAADRPLGPSVRRSPPRLRADDAEALSRAVGEFVILTGTPRRISTSRGRTYLNFGESWRSDTTVVVPEEVAKRWPSLTEGLSVLKGQHIEARGWATRANGPLVTIAHPLAIRRLGEFQTETGPGSHRNPEPVLNVDY